MPQLNPNPWFLIMALSWVILISTMPKIIKHEPTNPISQPLQQEQYTAWTWPW
uniref:ATP synthase complex subunit 8 n=1 Tax=Praslinia cooperi TaxID=420423 RepID=C9D8L5_PRACO|nr:ATP synthase F0 subunit 8 [Praslinia cooperi]